MYKQVFKDNFILVLQYAVSGLIPLLLIPHISRSIGLKGYGEIAIGLSLANYGAIVVQYAFQLTGPKQLAHLRPGKSAKDVFLEILVAKLLLLAGVMISSGIIITLLWQHEFVSSRSFLFILVPLGAAFNAVWYLQATTRFYVSSAISIVAAVVSLTVGFFLVSPGKENAVTTATLSLIIGTFIVGIGTFFAAKWFLRHNTANFHWRNALNLLVDGWPIFISQFTSALYTVSGPLIIGVLVSRQAAGAYSVMERFSSAIVSICLLTHTAAYPKLVILYNAERAAYWRLFGSVCVVYVTLTSLIVSITLLVGNLSGRFLFGTVSTNQNTLLCWGMTWVLLGILGPAVTGYLIVSGKQLLVWKLTIKMLFMSMIIGIPGVLFFGAWAWFASLILSQSLIFWVGYNAIKSDLAAG
jgi:O-antigen/teichoic acid export membrane protein